MQFYVVTLFPELLTSFAQTGLVGKAVAGGLLGIECEPLRVHGLGKHQSVDDTPYGGGSGMVLRVDCAVEALEAIDARAPSKPLRILLTPQGRPFAQPEAVELSRLPAVSLLSGRYEGFDERIRGYVDREISLGDFILNGGEVAAMAVIESVARLLPGVLGNAESLANESFSEQAEGLLEYPQYTRPAVFREAEVPEVLRSGDHARILAWRRARAEGRTRELRPDLLGNLLGKRRNS